MPNALSEEQIEQFKKAFARFDKYKRGSIATKDLPALMFSMGYNITETEMHKLIKEVDPKNKGAIKISNFITLMTNKMEQFTTIEQLRLVFSSFDADDDGFISPTELRYLIESNGGNTTEEEIKEMIAVVDVNGDGKVSFEEFCALIKHK